MSEEITFSEPESLRTAGWIAVDKNPAPVHIDFRPVLELIDGLSDYEVDKWWLRFCRRNKDVMGKLEINSEGALLVTPYPGWDGSKSLGEFMFALHQWAEATGGEAYAINLGVRLPNGSRYIPDACWVSDEQLELHKPDHDHIPLFCPAFIMEMRGYNEDLRVARRKMAEYIANGARLGWLIDPYDQQVHIYRPDADVEVLDNPETISSEDVLPGFVFEVRRRVFHLQW